MGGSNQHRVRLDPWAPEYESAVQLLEGGGDAPPDVDTRIESEAWEALRPAPERFSGRVLFVDGVRRVETRLLIERGEEVLFGLLGSIGVGAVEVDGTARVTDPTVARLCCAGGGLSVMDFFAVVRGSVLSFVPEPVPENTPMAPLQGLQNAMRRLEADLAVRLASSAEAVFLDGPLTFLGPGAGPILGFVKRLVRTYLQAPHSGLLPRLGLGERTPLFLVKDARYPRYSWYTRVGRGRAVDSALVGVVRLETMTGMALDAVRRLADASARLLPRFASHPARDPRAPQNLTPIGGLEARLRHLLGDPLLVRRAIEAHLHGALT
jgi:hypothetical protein